MSRNRSVQAARGALSTLLAVTCLALGACSSDDSDASEQNSSAPSASLPPSAVPPTASPTASSESSAPLTSADLPARSDLVLAAELDTNAPVDPAALDGTVTPTQVQAIRRAWNERQVAVESADSGWCKSAGDGIWVAATPVESGAPVLTYGVVGQAKTLTCSLDEALLLVDSETRQVLGDEAVAQLL